MSTSDPRDGHVDKGWHGQEYVEYGVGQIGMEHEAIWYRQRTDAAAEVAACNDAALPSRLIERTVSTWRVSEQVS